MILDAVPTIETGQLGSKITHYPPNYLNKTKQLS
jgi:hypothetical protein